MKAMRLRCIVRSNSESVEPAVEKRAFHNGFSAFLGWLTEHRGEWPAAMVGLLPGLATALSDAAHLGETPAVSEPTSFLVVLLGGLLMALLVQGTRAKPHDGWDGEPRSLGEVTEGGPLQRIVAILQRLSALSEVNQVVSEAVLLIRTAFDVDRVSLWVPHLQSSDWAVRATTFPLPSDYRVERGAIPEAAAQGVPICLPLSAEAAEEARQLDGMVVELALPLMVQGHLLGVLHIAVSEAERLPPELVSLLEAFAPALAGLWQAAALATAEAMHNRYLEALHHTSLDIANDLDLDRILKAVLDRGMVLTGAEVGAVLLEGQRFETLTVRYGRHPTMSLMGHELTPGEGLIGRAWEQGRTLVGTELMPRNGHGVGLPEVELSAAVAVPLKWGAETLGILLLGQMPPGKPFDPNDISVVEKLAQQAAIAVRHATLYDELTDRATAQALQRDLLAQLYQGLAEITRNDDIQGVLQLMANFIQRSGWRRVSVTLRDAELNVTHIATAGFTPEEFVELRRITTPGGPWRERLGPRYEPWRQGEWYYLPGRDPEVQALLGGIGVGSHFEYSSSDSWDPLDSLYMPMRNRAGQPIGLVVMDDPEDGQAPTRTNMNPIVLFVRNAALMLENRRLTTERERQLAMTLTLQETAALVSSTLDLTQILSGVVSTLVERFGYPLIAIYLMEQGELRLQAAHGYDLNGIAARVPQGRGVLGRAVTTRQTIFLADVVNDPDFIALVPGVTAEIVVPLLRTETVLGVINVESTAERPLTEEDRDLLSALGEQITTAIYNAQLFGETQHHALMLEAATEVSRRVSSILDIDRLLGEIVELIQRTFGYDHVHIYLREDDFNNRGQPIWILREGTGDVGMQLRAQRHLYRGAEGVVGMAGMMGQALLIPDVRMDPTIPPNPLLPETRSELAVPLKLGRSVLGVLDVRSHTASGLTGRDQVLLETLANQIGIAVHNAQLFAATEMQLVERESLYRASHQISGAMNVEAILEGIFDTMRVTHGFIEGAAALLNGPIVEDQAPDWVEVAAVWVRDSVGPTLQAGVRYNRAQIPAVSQLRGTRTLIFDDILHSEALDAQAKLVFGARRGIRSAVLLPLGSGQRINGWLLMLSRQPAIFTPSVLQPYETLADQAALAIERSRLLDQTQQRALRLAALNEMAARITATLDLGQTLRDSTGVFASFFGVPQSGLVLFDYEKGWGELVARYSGGRTDTPELPPRIPLANNPLIDRLVETREPVPIFDAQTDPLLEPIRHLVQEYGYLSILVVPLIVRDTVVGSISLDVLEARRHFEPEEIELAQTIAFQIATAIQNAQLYDEANLRLNETRSLYLAGREITGAHTPERVMDAVLTNLIHAEGPAAPTSDGAAPTSLLRAPADRIMIMLFGPASEPLPLWLDYAAGWDGRGLPIEIGQRFDLHTLVPLLRPRAEMFVHNDLENEGLDGETLKLFQSFQLESVAGLPLRASGVQRGWLLVGYKQPHTWHQDDLRPLQTLADQAAVALENQQLLAQAQQAVREEAALRSVLEAIGGATDEGDAFEALAGTAVSLLELPLCIVSEWIIDEEEWRIRALVGEDVRDAALLIPMPAEQRRNLRAGALIDLSLEGTELSPLVAEAMMHYGAKTLWRIPLRIRGELVAVLDLLSARERRLIGDARRLASTLAQQSATALDNLRLFQQTERRASRLAAINQVSATLSQTLQLQDLLEIGVREIGRALNVSQASMILIDPQAEVARLVAEYAATVAVAHTVEMAFPIHDSPTLEQIVSSRRPIPINDVQAMLALEGDRDRVLLGNRRSVLLVPMVMRDEVIGTIELASPTLPRRWNRDEIELAQTMANQIAGAVQNATLFAEARARANQLEAVSEVSRRLSSILELDRLLSQVVTVIRDSFGYYHVHIFLRDENDPNLMVVREGAGEIGQALKERRHALALGRGVVGTAAATGDLCVANDVTKSPEYRPNPLLPHTRAEIALPLKIGAEVIGILDVQSTEAHRFGHTEQAILGALADQIAIAVNNALLYREQAHTVQQLQEVDRLKSEFLASMSHELRTPLNSIIGFSKVILKGIDGPLTDMQRQDITSIYNSGQHLLSLITDILDLSKIAAGKMTLYFEQIPLRDIVDDVMRTSEVLVKDKPIILKSQLEEGLPVLMADRTRLKQIVLNLMSNAIKFTEKGSVRLEATRLREEPSNFPLTMSNGSPAEWRNCVRITVTDSGIGIKPEDQELVFEEFRQVDGSSTRRAGGTGLGLAISRRLVEMHGGVIWLESDGVPGKGTSFHFVIPLASNGV